MWCALEIFENLYARTKSVCFSNQNTSSSSSSSTDNNTEHNVSLQAWWSLLVVFVCVFFSFSLQFYFTTIRLFSYTCCSIPHVHGLHGGPNDEKNLMEIIKFVHSTITWPSEYILCTMLHRTEVIIMNCPYQSWGNTKKQHHSCEMHKTKALNINWNSFRCRVKKNECN